MKFTPGISGFYTPRLIHEVLHNRTANLRGGVAKNIALDRVCEFLNADFKGGNSAYIVTLNCFCYSALLLIVNFFWSYMQYFFYF